MRLLSGREFYLITHYEASFLNLDIAPSSSSWVGSQAMRNRVSNAMSSIVSTRFK